MNKKKYGHIDCDSLGLEEKEKLVFSLPAFLKDGGEPAGLRLVVTTERIILAGLGEGELRPLRTRRYSQLTGVEEESFPGGGRLLVSKNGKPEVLAYYGPDQRTRYAQACGYLSQILEYGEVPEFAGFEDVNCPQCGLPLTIEGDTCPHCIDRLRLLRRLVGIMRPYLPQIIAVSAIFWLTTGINLLLPQLQRILIDDFLRPQVNDPRLFLIFIGGIGLARISNSILAIVRGRLMVRIGAGLGRDLREMVYTRIQVLSLRFIDRRKTGDLMNRTSRDTQNVQSFIERHAAEAVNQLLTVVGIGIILFLSSWQLALLILVPIPCIIWFSRITWVKIRNMYRKQWSLVDRANSLLQDVLSGIRVVKAYGGEMCEIKRFNDYTGRVAETTAANEKTWSTLYPSLSFIMGFGNFLILYYGGYLVQEGGMRVGELIQFTAYATMLYQPLQYMTFIPRWFHQAMTSSERIFEVVDQEPEILEPKNPVRAERLSGEIELEDVTFGYVRHKPVLRDINIQIRPGEMIGLVGHSGAGKSTLINLINRLYDVDEGRILIDGVDIRRYAQRDLRRQIGVVLQDIFLFSGTVWENIAYARPQATPEEILRAARIANAHDFVLKFPDGYDTRVGERGQRLSGGERQRIAIARAILHDPRILILDEATSSLDTETEQKIQEALARLVADRTTIAIAHRLSTLRNADRLLVLKDGRQIELGTHEELMQMRGEYHRLITAQRKMNRMQAVSG